MKLKFLATGNAPEHYTIEAETITAHYQGESESVDLSSIEEGGKFQGIEPETLELNGSHIIRKVERIDGKLQVTLCQKANKGHWRESGWIDANNYDPEKTYIKEAQ